MGISKLRKVRYFVPLSRDYFKGRLVGHAAFSLIIKNAAILERITGKLKCSYLKETAWCF